MINDTFTAECPTSRGEISSLSYGNRLSQTGPYSRSTTNRVDRPLGGFFQQGWG